MTLRSVVKGTGSALPQRRVDNQELAAQVDTSDEWIVERTGIRSRYIAADGETTATLAVEACRNALEAAGLQPGGAVVDAAALEQFQRQWATYQKLVDSDELSHAALGALLHDTLNRSFDRPFSFLDIACGDASEMRALLGTKVRHYHGVDLSEPALELAANNLKPAALDHAHAG